VRGRPATFVWVRGSPGGEQCYPPRGTGPRGDLDSTRNTQGLRASDAQLHETAAIVATRRGLRRLRV